MKLLEGRAAQHHRSSGRLHSKELGAWDQSSVSPPVGGCVGPVSTECRLQQCRLGCDGLRWAARPALHSTHLSELPALLLCTATLPQVKACLGCDHDFQLFDPLGVGLDKLLLQLRAGKGETTGDALLWTGHLSTMVHVATK